MTPDRVTILMYPTGRDSNATNGTHKIPVFYVETHDELLLYRDEPGPHSANDLLMGAVFLVATSEHWGQLLLLVAAGHAEVWHMYDTTRGSYITTPILQPENLSRDWPEIIGAKNIAEGLRNRNSLKGRLP